MPSVEGPKDIACNFGLCRLLQGWCLYIPPFLLGLTSMFNVSRRMTTTLNLRDWAVAVGGSHARDCQHYKKVACISASL